MRVKTVELIEEELPWEAPLPSGKEGAAQVLLRIAYEETELRESVKSAGGVWVKERKLWRIPYAQACALGLEKRVVEK